jgi:large repetitive protein
MQQPSRSTRWVFLLLVVHFLGESILVAQETYKPLAPGLAYRHEIRADGPLSIHSVRIDRKERHWDIRTGLGQGTVYGLEPLDGIIGRTATVLGKPAFAAINGDRFVIQPGPYQGDPQGVQILDGQLVSRPTGNAFRVAANGTPNAGPVASKLRVVWADGRTETAIGLNEARADDSVVLYTPILGISANDKPKASPGTRTQGGKELVLERVEGQRWLPIVVGMTYSGTVVSIHSRGDTPISPDRMVLSIGPKRLLGLPPVKQGDTLRLIIETEPDLRGVRTAIGAGRILIQNGKSPDVGPANQPRHPRSMIGWNQRHLYFVVIDGRQSGISVGMSYPEMATLAKEYRCTNAIELDGGGSSTLWAMGKILSSPSDGKARAIANGLILFRSDE